MVPAVAVSLQSGQYCLNPPPALLLSCDNIARFVITSTWRYSLFALSLHQDDKSLFT